MWPRVLVLVLLAYCLCCVPAQHGGEAEGQRSIWENPIQFKTKADDLCTMHVTGQGELTMLRISCRGRGRSYWCDYAGKPHTCRSYSSKPRHYFLQMMWGLRKLQNACQAPRVIKPHMCKRASDEAQMVLSSSPFIPARPETTRATSPSRPGVRPEIGLVRPEQSRPEEPASEEPGVRTTPSPEPTEDGPTTPAPTSKAQKMAGYYCWKSLRGICAFFIGWFHK